MKKIIVICLIMLSACQPKNTVCDYFSKNVEINNNVIEIFLSLCNDEFGKIKQKGFSFYEGYKITKTGSMHIIYELTKNSLDTIQKFVSNNSIYSDTSYFQKNLDILKLDVLVGHDTIYISPYFISDIEFVTTKKYKRNDFVPYIIQYGKTEIFRYELTKLHKQQNYTLGVYLTKDNKYAICWLYYYD